MNYWHWAAEKSRTPRPISESTFKANAANNGSYMLWLVRTDDLLIFYFNTEGLWIQWRTP